MKLKIYYLWFTNYFLAKDISSGDLLFNSYYLIVDIGTYLRPTSGTRSDRRFRYSTLPTPLWRIIKPVRLLDPLYAGTRRLTFRCLTLRWSVTCGRRVLLRCSSFDATESRDVIGGQTSFESPVSLYNLPWFLHWSPFVSDPMGDGSNKFFIQCSVFRPSSSFLSGTSGFFS